MNPWETKNLDEGPWSIGPLGEVTIFANRKKGDWQYALRRGDQIGGTFKIEKAKGIPEDLDPHRLVTQDLSPALLLRPQMPDRPVIVRPELPLRIAREEKIDIFVSIPTWVEAFAGQKKIKLFETPTEELSNSWFGDFASGELCYAIRTSARLELFWNAQKSHRAMCRVSIVNKSEEEMEFQRQCLRVRFLKIYLWEGHLVTNTVGLSFLGQDEDTQLDYGQNAPDFAGGGILLTEPREVPTGRLFLVSFKTARNLIRG